MTDQNEPNLHDIVNDSTRKLISVFKDETELKSFVHAIVVKRDSALLVKTAEKLAGELRNAELNTTQTRALYNSVLRIRSQWVDDGVGRHKLWMLKPRMTYQARRNPQVESLQRVLDAAIDKVFEAPQHGVRERDAFESFKDFFEAILAYSYPGQEEQKRKDRSR